MTITSPNNSCVFSKYPKELSVHNSCKFPQYAKALYHPQRQPKIPETYVSVCLWTGFCCKFLCVRVLWECHHGMRRKMCIFNARASPLDVWYIAFGVNLLYSIRVFEISHTQTWQVYTHFIPSIAYIHRHLQVPQSRTLSSLTNSTEDVRKFSHTLTHIV